MTAVETFTHLSVISLPTPWPPTSVIRLMESAVGTMGSSIKWLGYPDGHIEVVVSGSAIGLPIHRHFQRISAPEGNWAITTLTFDGAELCLRINGGEGLRLLSESSEFISLSAPTKALPLRSFDEPGAQSACLHWISERNRRFSKKPRFVDKDHVRRLKTTDEQLRELAEAAFLLSDVARQVQDGSLHMVPVLASQMRGLAYWPNDRPTWNPLLYRLAAGRNLPLPIFCLLNSVPPVTAGLAIQLQVSGASVQRMWPTQRLVDLEQYLNEPVARFDLGTSAAREISVIEAVAATANTAGIAHYDDSVVLDIEGIKSHLYVGTNLLDRVIVNLAHILVDMCEYVKIRYSST
jgi:hypothetical protein